VNLVYISVNRDEKVFKDYMKKSQLEKYLPVYYDRNRTTWKRFKLDRTPTTFILDERGVIINKWTGYINWNSVRPGDLRTFKN